VPADTMEMDEQARWQQRQGGRNVCRMMWMDSGIEWWYWFRAGRRGRTEDDDLLSRWGPGSQGRDPGPHRICRAHL